MLCRIMSEDAEEKKEDLIVRKGSRSLRDQDNEVPSISGSVQVILPVPLSSQTQSSILTEANEVAIIQDKVASDKGTSIFLFCIEKEP